MSAWETRCLKVTTGAVLCLSAAVADDDDVSLAALALTLA
jgi:hypothetical protein